MKKISYLFIKYFYNSIKNAIFTIFIFKYCAFHKFLFLFFFLFIIFDKSNRIIRLFNNLINYRINNRIFNTFVAKYSVIINN
jgi:hypothetical protein